MTNEEFEKIVCIKSEIDELNQILNGKYKNKSNFPKIIEIHINHVYNHCVDNIEIKISKFLEQDILKLIEQRLEKLNEEFENFKTE